VLLEGSLLLNSEVLEGKCDEFIFDLVVTDEQNVVVEKWNGVTFRKVGVPRTLRFDAPVLLAPFMERYIKPLFPSMDLIVRMQREEKRPGTNGEGSATPYRPDGKPIPVQGASHISNAYSQGWKLSVSSSYPVACDLEWFSASDDTPWPQLLGADRYALAKAISDRLGEEIGISAARVWTLLEAVKKLGLPAYTAITLDPASQAHCVVCRASTARVYCAMARTADHSIVLASLAVAAAADPCVDSLPGLELSVNSN